MRKGLLLWAPPVLAALILYAVWEPFSEPTTPLIQDNNSDPDVFVTEEVVSPEEPGVERSRIPVPEPAEEAEVTARLTVEDHRHVLQQLVEGQAEFAGKLLNQRKVMEAATTEMTFQEEFERFQDYSVLEAKYRRAMGKLQHGQFTHRPRSSASMFGGVAGSGEVADEILGLGFDQHYVLFEFTREQDAELYALVDGRKETERALQQYQCDEFNRLPPEKRKARIEAHYEASEILEKQMRERMERRRERMREGKPPERPTPSPAQDALRRKVLPSFMVIDEDAYTVRLRHRQ